MKEEFDVKFDIQTLFGSRDLEEFHELIARGVLEVMNQDDFLIKKLNERGLNINQKSFVNPFKAKNLLLSFGIKLPKECKEEFEKFLFQKIVLSVKERIIDFFFI